MEPADPHELMPLLERYFLNEASRDEVRYLQLHIEHCAECRASITGRDVLECARRAARRGRGLARASLW